MAKVKPSEGLKPQKVDVSSPAGLEDEGVRMKKELGLINGVSIIAGVIIGSGIFVSPSIAIKYAGSKGVALIVWVLSGLLTLVGALCYAELGTMIPKSGGDYAYLAEACGDLPAFLYLWAALIVLVPSGNAITALTFATNILQPLWPACSPPGSAVMLIAAVLTCVLTAINCYDVKWVTRVQDWFTSAKILAFLVIFLASMWYAFSGHTENLENFMDGATLSPGGLAIAFYSGLFSYSGWNFLNHVTEELKDPYKNLPRAICISMPIVTVIYTLTNLAFFVVLSTDEILASEAVAVTFSEKILGPIAWCMPLFVAFCTFGSLNGAIYTSSRLFFVGARNGHLPKAIAMINIKRLTPIPALIFMCILTLLVLMTNAVEPLIVYMISVEAIFTIWTLGGLLWLRYKKPNLERPYRVNLILPLSFLVVVTALVIFSCTVHPKEVIFGIFIVVAGIPIYWVFILWRNKPKWLEIACNSFNIACSKMFFSVPEELKDL